MTTLEQRVRFKTFKFEIDDAGLSKKITLRNGESEFHTPFEKITVNRSYLVQDNKTALVAGVLLLLISIIVFLASFSDKSIQAATALLWLAFSCIGFVAYFKTKERKLFLITSENATIEFYNDKPTKEMVNIFINELIKQRNIYLNSKYGQPSKRLEYTPQLDNFNWLLNTKVISKAEYDQKMAVLNSLFHANPGNNKIGFSPSM